MKFILIYLLKLAATLLLISILGEIALALWNAETPQQGQIEWIKLAQQAFNQSIYYVHNVELGNFKFIGMLKWIFLNHFYYFIIVLLAFLFYYEYRIKKLTQPSIPLNPVSRPPNDQSNITEIELTKLCESREFHQFLDNNYPFRRVNQDVLKELEEKEEQIYEQ